MVQVSCLFINLMFMIDFFRCNVVQGTFTVSQKQLPVFCESAARVSESNEPLLLIKLMQNLRISFKTLEKISFCIKPFF